MSFNTLDEGIKGYLDILYNNYYSKGLTTPELMNPTYAASTTWASKVNWYIEKIKTSAYSAKVYWKRKDYSF